MNFVCSNGNWIPSNHPAITAQNRSFKWGDGLFETIKVSGKNILLQSLHFDRLFSGIKLVEINPDADFTREALISNILELCRRNQCEELARVRLAVYRSDQNSAGYLIEALPMDPAVNRWNEQGLALGLYPLARKAMDVFANIKSASFLPYVLAARHAAENNLDDALVLNAVGQVCDSSKANVFLIRGKALFTPALNQGCIDGVMRRFLLEALRKNGYAVHEEAIGQDEILDADEVFLTNAIFGMRWVGSFGGKQYRSHISAAIYQGFVSTIYA